MLTIRNLQRQEIDQIWTIDRSEVIDHIYYFENGTLVLKPEHYDVPGWPPGEAEKYAPLLFDCYDRGGWFCGLFDDAHQLGVAVLENKFIGPDKDQLQLKFLHVSRAYRGRGLGRRLFQLAQTAAREKGARRLYISATPFEHTINFYLGLGCRVSPDPDPELFELEPEDIHLESEV